VKRLEPSIDEMARDARALVGEDPRAWAAKFTELLGCYGWRVVSMGPVYFHPRAVVLEDWDIVRRVP
jgi:hypothetical protein